MSAAILPDHAATEALAILMKHLQMPVRERSEGSGVEMGVEKEFGTVKHLRLQEEQMESAVTAFTNIINRRIKSLRRQRNHLSPVYRLPTEIIASIFETVVANRSERQLPYYLSSDLAMVCSRWRDIALSTPRLWAYISNALNESLVALCIERSQNTPLNIYFKVDLSWDEEREASYFDMVVPHLIRWESFKCDASPDSLLPRLEGKSLPFLRNFDIFVDNFDIHDLPYAISHNAPQLRSLHILPYSFPLDSPVFSTLRSIQFRPAVGKVRLLPEQWHSFLSTCQELEHLEVDGHNVPAITPQPITPFEVFLPRLDSVILSGLPVSIVGFLLSSISTNWKTVSPVQITNPWIDFDEEDEGFEKMFPPTTTDTTLLAFIRTMTSISVNCPIGSLTLTAKAGGEVQKEILHYSSYDIIGSPTELWRALLSSEVRSQLTSIVVKGSLFLDNNDFSSNLHQYTSLERLFIHFPDPPRTMEGLYHVCERLCERRSSVSLSDADFTFVVPCLKLRSLGIFTPGADLRCVAAMIQARYGDNPSSDTEAPAQLEELTLSNTEGEMVTKVFNDMAILRIKDIIDPFRNIVQVVNSIDLE